MYIRTLYVLSDLSTFRLNQNNALLTVIYIYNFIHHQTMIASNENADSVPWSSPRSVIEFGSVFNASHSAV